MRIGTIVLTCVCLTGLTAPASAMLHPGQGRFVQRDPLEYVDGMHLAQYQGGSPISMLDPTGLDACDGKCPTAWTAGTVFGVRWQYGCYCGLEPTPPRAVIPPPIDGVDSCCQTHDTCYAAALPGAAGAAARQVCDANFCACAKHTAQTGGCLSIRCQNAATQIQTWYGPC